MGGDDEKKKDDAEEKKKEEKAEDGKEDGVKDEDKVIGILKEARIRIHSGKQLLRRLRLRCIFSLSLFGDIAFP